MKVRFSYTIPNMLEKVNVEGFKLKIIPNTNNTRLEFPGGNLTDFSGHDLFWLFQEKENFPDFFEIILYIDRSKI